MSSYKIQIYIQLLLVFSNYCICLRKKSDDYFKVITRDKNYINNRYLDKVLSTYLYPASKTDEVSTYNSVISDKIYNSSEPNKKENANQTKNNKDFSDKIQLFNNASDYWYDDYEKFGVTEENRERIKKIKNDTYETAKDKYNLDNMRQRMETIQSPDDIQAKFHVKQAKRNKTNKISDNKKINSVCRNYKNVSMLNISQMADVWQTVYYDMPKKVGCFKMHIKKITLPEKAKYANCYGTFNGTINWDLCDIEIESSKLMRKHFLQETNDNGILDNIIIIENERKPQLIPETPDQWLVYKNMLLMRDCNTGYVMVFSRVPYQPNKYDVVEALKEFGEDNEVGRVACDYDDSAVYRLNRQVYDVDDDEASVFDDVVFFENFITKP